MTIYCTYLTVYNGNLMPKFYIGYTRLDKIEKGYHGSVRSKSYIDTWKKELLEHPELFITYVLTKHNSKTDALEREAKFHEQLRVHRNSMYINMATANGKFYNPFTQETRNKLSLIHTGKKRSEETRRKLSEVMKGKNKGKKRSQAFRDGVSAAHTGKKRSEETRQKIRLGKLGKKFTQSHRDNISKARKELYEKRREASNH